jgi:hypothetical protein
MLKLKSIFLVFLLGISFISCSPEDIGNDCPCVDGNCDATFYVDVVQNPGSYQDAQGVWHVKWSGLHYFRIKGQADQLNSEHVVNGVPLIETGYDSNFFYTPTGITWTYPLYSYLGVFSNNNLTNPIPVGSGTYTLPQIVGDTSVSNLAGYQISRYFNFNHPAAKTMLQTYSKYTYNPVQQMPFHQGMIGKTADIYIRVLFNSDFSGATQERVYKLTVKFEQ